MRTKSLIILLLALGTLVVYGRAVTNEFINYDDPLYVTENARVQNGLTVQNVRWAFTSLEASNWHPVTWLSHMADCQVFGLDPLGHHLTSVLLHLANTILVFLLLSRMTGALWPSAFVAALFALHPLHVESVAWVAERKDVLSTLFFLLALLSYTWYVRNPRPVRYLLIVVVFALGLMAKPMLVTFPFVLLLLDYWPLGRLSFRTAIHPENSSVKRVDGYTRLSQLLVEKVPLLFLTAVSCFLTIYAQSAGEAISRVEHVPLLFRLVNALTAYVAYLGKLFWPTGLAVLYPLPGTIPLQKGIIAALILTLISILVCLRWRRSPYLPVGWLWFIGTLVPVIGLVQVGSQAMADRYTYLPSIGLFIMLSWGAAELLRRRPIHPFFPASAAVLMLALCSILTWRQIGFWKDSITLFSRTLQVTQNNYLIQNNLGVELASEGRPEEAIEHYRESVRINPIWVTARLNLAAALVHQGKMSEAIEQFRKAVRQDPENIPARFALAMALGQTGQIDAVVEQLSEVVRLDPDSPEAHYNLGVALAQQGKLDMAAIHFLKTLRLRPNFSQASEALERVRQMKAAKRPGESESLDQQPPAGGGGQFLHKIQPGHEPGTN